MRALRETTIAGGRVSAKGTAGRSGAGLSELSAGRRRAGRCGERRAGRPAQSLCCGGDGACGSRPRACALRPRRGVGKTPDGRVAGGWDRWRRLLAAVPRKIGGGRVVTGFRSVDHRGDCDDEGASPPLRHTNVVFVFARASGRREQKKADGTRLVYIILLCAVVVVVPREKYRS